MHPDHEDLIQQLTRPLEANAELHLAARSYLLDRLGEAGADKEVHEEKSEPRGRVCENAGEWKAKAESDTPRCHQRSYEEKSEPRGRVCENAGEWKAKAESDTPRCHQRSHVEKSEPRGRVCENAGEWESHGGAQNPRAVTSAATQSPDIPHVAFPPKPWRRWFYLAVAALIVALSSSLGWKSYEVWNTTRTSGYMSMLNSEKPYQPMKIRNLPQKEKILLLGDESLDEFDAERWRALWQLEPENPVFLAKYAKTYSAVKKSVSPEILDAAARIDPGNALYPLMQATSGSEAVIDKPALTPAEKKAGKRKEWVIKNSSELESRVALLHRAASMPSICGYERPLLEKQLAVLPASEDLLDQTALIVFRTGDSSWIKLASIPKLLAAKASECAKHGDIEGFHATTSDWKSLCRKAASGGSSFLDALITRAMLSGPLEDFRDAARELGLEDEARRFDEFDKWFKQMRADEKSRSYSADPTMEMVMQKGSTILALSTPLIWSKVKNPTPITADDLRPGRYADHALLGRFVSLTAAVVFLLLAGVAALCRFRQSALIRALSPVMTVFLRVSDCLWILGLGVLVPLAWLLVVQFFTPFGAREWSLRFSAMIMPCVQFGVAALLVVLATLVTAGWRLGRRGAAFGLRGKHQWIGWVMAGILILAIPAVGVLPGWKPSQTERGLQFSLAVLLGAPVFWLGISLLLNLLNRADQSLRRATLARVMIPTWMFAAAAFACLIPVYHQSEKHWVQNDRLMDLANPEVEYTRYEAEMAKVFHKELLELMEERF